MINILILKKNQDIITIEATGHSGYSATGSDIVCSAVSTLMQTLANGLTEIVKLSPKVIIDETIPHMMVSLSNLFGQDMTADKAEYAQILMRTTALSLTDIANSYSKYIKIKEKQQ